MIAKEQKEAVIFQDGEIGESIKMSLDENSTQLLMQMLSKNLYSDPIGSTIREVASNALDSHRRLGVKEPIIVSLKPDENGNWEFSVEDFGTGLDSDDVKNIISKYGKSTKRESINELGMFGLGWKAPLSYSSSFYFVCRKDGIERKYMMYEGETINSIDLLYETTTEHKNGVKVIVPVQNSDTDSFRSKIKQQLAYFEDVWFDILDRWKSNYISNDFKIIREVDWQYSELTQDGQIHLCLDNVYYPLQLKDLGIKKSIYFPIALRFNLDDGLYPIPNREAIRMTEEVKPIILEKLRNVVTYMVDLYNSKIESVSTFDDVVSFYNSESRKIFIAGHEFNVAEFNDVFESINLAVPKLEGIEKLDLKRLVKNKGKLFYEYIITNQLKGGSISKDSGILKFDNVYKKYQLYIYENSIPSLFKEYIRDTKYNDVLFIKKRKKLPLRDRLSFEEVSYYSLCGLKHHPKNEWRQVITEFQSIIKSYTLKFTEASVDNIPQDWKNKREERLKNIRDEKRKLKEAARKEKMHGDICIKNAVRLDRSVGNNQCKFEAAKIIIDDIPKMKGLIVYDIYENEKRLNYLYEFKREGQLYKIFSVSNREAKRLQGLNYHNLLTYDEFMKGETKAFSRIATACLVNELIDDHYGVFIFSGLDIIKRLSNDLYEKMQRLNEYKKKNASHMNGPAQRIIAEFAEVNGLYDGDIYPLYNEVKTLLYSININPILSHCDYKSEKYNKAVVAMLVEVFKYRKIKLNLEHYSKPSIVNTEIDVIEEEEQEVEIQEEEMIEELEINTEQFEEEV